MRIRKEESRPSRGQNGEGELSRQRGVKRKCAEEANELIKAVIGSEMLGLSSDDSFEGSSEERKIFTSVFPTEEHSESSMENTSTTDVSPDGCDRCRALRSCGIRGGEKGPVLPRIEVCVLRKKNEITTICAPGTSLRKGEVKAGKAELRDTGVSQYSGSTRSSTRMQKKLKTSENASEEITPRQEYEGKWNGGIRSTSQNNNQDDDCQECGKLIKMYANKILFANHHGCDSQENHDVFDNKLQAEFEKSKGRRCLNNFVQGEQNRKTGGNENRLDCCLSASQSKITKQRRASYPIVESSGEGMVLRRHVRFHPQENNSNSFSADRANKNSGHRNSSFTNMVLEDKIKHKEVVDNCRRLSLPILSEENQTGKEAPTTEQRKNLRERAKLRLLAAGWKIEFKPRAHKDYQDSVYISPWGTSFWSLPQAWNALRKSLDANATNNEVSSTTQSIDKKRPLERGGDFWSELNETLLQLESGGQNWNASTHDRVNEVNPLMSMVYTEDPSILKKRKKDRCKEDEQKKVIDEEDEHSNHSMKGYNGHSSKILESLQPVTVEKMGVNPDELCGPELQMVVCKERDNLGRELFSEKQKSTNGKLSNSGDLCTTAKLSYLREVSNTHGKLLDGGEERNMYRKVFRSGDLRSSNEKLQDDIRERNIDGQQMYAGNQRGMNGILVDAQKKQKIHGNLTNINDQCCICEKLLHAGDRSVHHQLLITEGESGLCAGLTQSGNQGSHGKHLSVVEPRAKHGGLFIPVNLRNIHEKLSSDLDQSGIHEVVNERGKPGKTFDISEQRSKREISNQTCLHRKVLVSREQRSTNGTSNLSCMHGKHLDGKEHRSVRGSNKQCGMHGELLEEREQRSVCQISNHNSMCRKHSEVREQRIMPRISNQSHMCGKACHLGGQRCMHEMLLSATERSKICGKISHAGQCSSTDEICLYLGKKRCIEEKLPTPRELQSRQEMLHVGETESMCEKLSNGGKQNLIDNYLSARNIKSMSEKLLNSESSQEMLRAGETESMSEKLSNGGKQNLIDSYLSACNIKIMSEKRLNSVEQEYAHSTLYAGEKRDISNDQSHAATHRSVCAKVFCAGDLKEESCFHRKVNDKFLQQHSCGESHYYALRNKSILKGLGIIQEEIADREDALLSSTKTEEQFPLNSITVSKTSDVVKGLQKTEELNSIMPLRASRSNNARVFQTGRKPKGQIKQVGRNVNDRKRKRNLNESEAGQMSEEELACLAWSNSKQQVRRTLNDLGGSKINNNIIERELSRQLSELELDKNPCKGENGAFRKSMVSLVGRLTNNLERGSQFDEDQARRLGRGLNGPRVSLTTEDCNGLVALHGEQASKTGKISYVSHAGRKSEFPCPWDSKTGKQSNELQASKLKRKSKKLQAGRQFNKAQVGNCPKSCTESSEVRIENEPKMKMNEIIIDDDNVTLASILKNRKQLSSITKASGGSCAKSKPVTREISFSTGEKSKKRKGGCALSVRSSSKRDNHSKGDGGFSSTSKRTALTWLIKSGVIYENERVQYLNTKSNRITKHGWITRDGILCTCCNKVLTTSKFSIHAGSKTKRPLQNILLQSGKSLAICQIEVWSMHYKQRNGGMRFVDVDENDQNDDACGICGDGGDLICCDNCPSTFHQDCLALKDVPEGNWYCPNCTCAICGTVGNDEGKANISNFLICRQCERKHHRKCLHERAIQAGELNAMDDVFCGQDCKKVSMGLHELLGISNPIEEGLTWSLLRSINEDLNFCSPQKLALMAECNTKLALAVSVMEDCFNRMLDIRTGIDMIPHVVNSWGSNFSRLNYQGFYTVVLEREDELISVASIRIHGSHFAEMPLIATCLPYRRQGMCRRLVITIEKMLVSLNVEKLILPAVPDLLEYWTTVFGFMPLEDSHKEEIKNMNMMTFPDTVLLQKIICRPENNRCIQTGEQLDQDTCLEGNILASQTQRDDIQCVKFMNTDTESALSTLSDDRNARTLIKTSPSEILSNLDESNFEKKLDNTWIADKERTANGHEGVWGAQVQVDNDVSALEKVCADSSICVPGGTVDVNTKAVPAQSKAHEDVEIEWENFKVLEARSINHSNNSVLDAQLHGDNPEALVLDQTRIESAHVAGDVAVISTNVGTEIFPEEKRTRKCGNDRETTFEIEEERTSDCAKGEGLDAESHRDMTLMVHQENSTLYSNGSVLDARTEGDNAEVSLPDRKSSESAWFVRGDRAYSNAGVDAMMFAEDEETCKKILERISEKEEERTSSCLRSGESDVQADGDGAEAHRDNILMVEKEKSTVDSNDSFLDAHMEGDNAEVSLQDNTNSEFAQIVHDDTTYSNTDVDAMMFPEERISEKEEERTSSCLRGEELDVQVDGDGAEGQVLQKVQTEPVSDTAYSHTGVDAMMFPEEEETCKKILERISEKEEERTSSCLRSEELDVQADGDGAEVQVLQNVQTEPESAPVVCATSDMAEVQMQKRIGNSGMST